MSYFAQKRRFLLTACLSLSAIVLVALSFTTLATREDSFLVPINSHPESSPQNSTSLAHPVADDAESLEDEYEYSPFVRGPPTQSFRDNLRDDTKYITSWISAGWSTSSSVWYSSR